MRNCTGDEGMLVPRSRLAGAGFKTPQAALVKSHCGDVCLQKVLDKSGIKIREGFRFQIPFSGRLSNL